AGLLGGELTGSLEIGDISGAARSPLHAPLNGISLAAAKGLANSPSLQNLKLTGRANAIADATWGKTFNNLVANTNATARGSVPSAADANAKPVPLNGVIHAKYLAASNE